VVTVASVNATRAASRRPFPGSDMIRDRPNDRRLSLGDGHVRNGDRFRVIGPGIA
jgi:hypothetical protein